MRSSSANGDGQVPLRKLQQHMMKLPRNVSRKEIPRSSPDEGARRHQRADAERSAAQRRADPRGKIR